MNGVDYPVLAACLALMPVLGYRLRARHESRDSFPGGRKLRVFPLTLSTMATPLSVIGFTSAPAFPGLGADGDRSGCPANAPCRRPC